MPENTMTRFYSSAAPEEIEGGWTIALDGRPIKTPARKTLLVESKGLAAQIAAEWDGQGDVVQIPTLHLTRLVNVALDQTPQQRGPMIDEILKYCETDLLCFLAEKPTELKARQIETWRPIREWAGQTHNIVLLEVPGGVLAAPQPPASLEAARITPIVWEICN